LALNTRHRRIWVTETLRCLVRCPTVGM
jgi:hypothetical protein